MVDLGQAPARDITHEYASNPPVCHQAVSVVYSSPTGQTTYPRADSRSEPYLAHSPSRPPPLISVAPPATAIIATVAFSTLSRTGLVARRAYIRVALSLLCPRLLPMISRLAPPAACQEPRVHRRSCIRQSISFARSTILCHADFGSTRCLIFPQSGKTCSAPSTSTRRRRRISTLSGESTTVSGSRLLL